MRARWGGVERWRGKRWAVDARGVRGGSLLGTCTGDSSLFLTIVAKSGGNIVASSTSNMKTVWVSMI